jgi:hypothetical protein
MWLTERQTAKLYNIAPGTLRRQRWAKRGLPYHIIGRPDNNKRGGVIRYNKNEVEKYLEQNSVKP